MAKYITRRLVGLIPTLLLLLFLVVVLVDLIPGDIIDLMLAERTGSNDETARAALESQLGLDKSLPVRYVDYTLNVLRGDLGASLWTQRPVTELIAGRDVAEIGGYPATFHVRDFLDCVKTRSQPKGNADAACPIFPGQLNRHHWPFTDPAHAAGTVDVLAVHDPEKRRPRG